MYHIGYKTFKYFKSKSHAKPMCYMCVHIILKEMKHEKLFFGAETNCNSGDLLYCEVTK